MHVEAPPASLPGARWRKSTHSDLNECVEVALNLPGVVGVRDGKDPGRAVLVFASCEWRAFTADIKDGEFDI